MYCIFYYIFQIRIGRKEHNMKRCRWFAQSICKPLPNILRTDQSKFLLKKKNQQDKAEHRLGLLGKQR